VKSNQFIRREKQTGYYQLHGIRPVREKKGKFVVCLQSAHNFAASHLANLALVTGGRKTE